MRNTGKFFKNLNIHLKTNINISVITLIMSVTLIFSSCENIIDKKIDYSTEILYLSQIIIPQTALNLDNDTTGFVTPLGNSKYEISLTAYGSAYPANERVVECIVRIFKPSSSTPFFRVSLQLNPSSEDTLKFSIPLHFTINRSDVGLMKFEFSLTTARGVISNQITRTLQIVRQNSKPAIYNIIAPDTIYRPISGTIVLTFNVTANDSDGYGDIKEVFFKRIYPTETGNFLLYDDGDQNSHGDMIPGDALFSRKIIIDSTALIGEQIFLFRAQDKSGALSDSLLHTIMILP